MTTDQEIHEAFEKTKYKDSSLGFAVFRAGYMAGQEKLREQEPVYQVWRSTDNCNEFYSWDDCDKSDYDLASDEDRRILFEHPAPIPEWQPIATAPIDKNVILTDGESVEEGVFFSGSWRWNRNENIAFSTHWMPLPKPPMVARSEE